MDPLSVVLVALAVVLVLRLIAGAMDGDRIDAYVRERGGKVLTRSWAPFGRGWFGEKSDRIYEITYEDRDGNRRAATVKTSLFTGVYFTGDRIVHRERDTDRVAARDEVAELQAENARLRAELARRDEGRLSPRP
jgi:hypothetical protein